MAFSPAGVAAIDAANNQLTLGDGSHRAFDYLVICSGPRLAFEAVEGSGPEGFSQSICTVDHAVKAHEDVKRLYSNPCPVVIGACPSQLFRPCVRVCVVVGIRIA